MPERVQLKRAISFPLLLLYGLGTTVGAGIYALIGEVAGTAGGAAPISFLLASGLAALTALSFAELSALHPKSAGEAVYVREAFGVRKLASAVGLLVAASGCVSAATIVTGFAGYVGGLVDLPRAVAIIVAMLILALIAAWGVQASFLVAGLLTLIEIGGLLLIVWSARGSLAELPTRMLELAPGQPGASWTGILAGSLLAFYAFLGFEDMVNVAEEVKQVRRNMPLAIITTLAISSLLYLLVAITAVLSVPPEELARSEEPLTHIYRSTGGRAPEVISVIAILAILNGALVQIIMASRVLYGLAGEPFVPRLFRRIHPRTATPLYATALAAGVALSLALFFPLRDLAAATSLMTLLVFSAVNAALLRLRFVDSQAMALGRVPVWVPASGLIFNLLFFVYSLGSWILAR